MKSAAATTIALALTGSCATVTVSALLENASLFENRNATQGDSRPKVVIDPRIMTVQREFESAEAPEAYRKTRVNALALMAEGDRSHEALIAFQAALIAADCTYFATPAERQSQDRAWTKAELTDLHEAAQRLTAEVSRNWFASRLWLERYVNLLAATANQIVQGVLPQIEPELEVLSRQLAADAERTIPNPFSYRATVGQFDDIETGANLARLSWRYGSRDAARARLQDAIDQARHDGPISAWLQLEEERYGNERSLNPPTVPLQQLRDEARLGAQGLRESYSSRAGRIWVNAMFDEAYGPMLQDQISSSQVATPTELFRASETLKARTLLDELSAPPKELAEASRSRAESFETDVLGFPTSSSDKEDVLMQEIKLISQLSPFGPLGDPGGNRQASLAQLEQIYQSAAAGFTQAAKPASLERVQSALKGREAILEYVIPYNQFYRDQYLGIFLITHNEFIPVHLKLDDILPRKSANSISISVDGKAPITFSPLSDLVAESRKAIRADDDAAARSALNRLYRVLIEPEVRQGLKLENYDRLIIVPHGPLHYVPFSALLDDQGIFLVQKTAISLAPSASIWMLLQERPKGAIHNFLAFGNPTLNRPDLPSLRASESEVNAIAKQLDLPGADAKRVRVREEATEERLVQEAPGANLLHVATHGEFPDENALDGHGILLTQAKSNDGVLRASTVRKLNLSANRLVVLSVCNGGLYRIGPADEPYGLIPAFLQAGAQNAIGTLWKVEDIYGRVLTTEFYKSLLQVGPAEALRKASLTFIEQGQTIGRWSGFVCVGPGRRFDSQ